jgi:hypothetical protein
MARWLTQPVALSLCRFVALPLCRSPSSAQREVANLFAARVLCLLRESAFSFAFVSLVAFPKLLFVYLCGVVGVIAVPICVLHLPQHVGILLFALRHY